MNGKNLYDQIIEQAINLGASFAGIARVDALKYSPSHFVFGKLDRFNGVGTKNSGRVDPGLIAWPDNAASAVVVGLAHPESKPEMDWWQDGVRGGTIGNRILMDINIGLANWIEQETRYKTYKLPYHIENGGIFLKDAAVMAGLGCIGKNNLLVTSAYGPRVRLRAILLDAKLPASAAMEFDPCNGCDMPCRTICPQAAFQKKVYRNDKLRLDELPGRSGVYDRLLCNGQMEVDTENCEIIAISDHPKVGKIVKYCRLCEFACPVGKK